MIYLKSIAVWALVTLLAVGCSSDADSEDNSQTNAATSVKKSRPKSIPPLVNIGLLPKMDKEELRMARNTIFAKYGYVFESKDLQAYFSQQSWYKERPAFKEKDMKESDIMTVSLIKRWEEKTEVLWKEQADITGNGRFEDCYVLYNKNKGTFSVIINDFSEEFDHRWGQNKERKEAPNDWTKIQISLVDIDTNDNRKEIHLAQRYDDWEDPGTENFVVAFNKGVQITGLRSSNYDAGKLTFHGDGTVTMRYAHCPDHTKKFQLQKAALVQTSESIGSMPKGGCPACFAGSTLVSTSEKTAVPIETLQRGDQVLTFDTKTKSLKTTTVKRVLAVFHDNLYDIVFNDELLTVTEDHPFLTKNGWCSLAPEKTKQHYKYSNVSLLNASTLLLNADGHEVSVRSIKKSKQGQMTYTIESLENGTNFIVNGVIVGTEEKATIML